MVGSKGKVNISQTHGNYSNPFWAPKALKNPSTIVGPLLNLIIFDNFLKKKLTMQNPYQGTVAPPHDCNQFCDYGKILENEIMVKGTRGTKVKVFFQGL